MTIVWGLGVEGSLGKISYGKSLLSIQLHGSAIVPAQTLYIHIHTRHVDMETVAACYCL